MATALQTFRIIAPEFGPKSQNPKTDNEVTPVIDLVSTWLAPGVFGVRLCEAIAELAGHVLTKQARVERSLPGFASTGAVASVGVKGASFSHTAASSAPDSNEDDDLRSTTHGQAYLRIRDSRPIGFGIL